MQEAIDRAIARAKKIEINEDRQWLARTASGQDIYIDANIVKHLLQAHRDLDMAHVVEAIGKMDYSGSPDGKFCRSVSTIDLGRPVGYSGVKELGLEDQPQLAVRVGRERLSNVLVDQRGDETSKVFAVVGYIPKDGSYLFTASYSVEAPREPRDPSIKTISELAESTDYWNKHAICVSHDEIDWKKTSQKLKFEEDRKKKHSEAIKAASTLYELMNEHGFLSLIYDDTSVVAEKNGTTLLATAFAGEIRPEYAAVAIDMPIAELKKMYAEENPSNILDKQDIGWWAYREAMSGKLKPSEKLHIFNHDHSLYEIEIGLRAYENRSRTYMVTGASSVTKSIDERLADAKPVNEQPKQGKTPIIPTRKP